MSHKVRLKSSIPGKVDDQQEDQLSEEIRPSDLEKAGPSTPSYLPSSVLQACQDIKECVIEQECVIEAITPVFSEVDCIPFATEV